MGLGYTGKVGFPRKARRLEHNYTEPTPVEGSFKIVQEDLVPMENTLLKGLHLKDEIENRLSESFIPVLDSVPNVKTALGRLQSQSSEKIYFSFYKDLLESVYEDLLLENTIQEELTGIKEADSVLIQTRKSKRNSGLASDTLNMIYGGSQWVLLYFLHKVLLQYETQDTYPSIAAKQPPGTEKGFELGNYLKSALAGSILFGANTALKEYLEKLGGYSTTTTTTENKIIYETTEEAKIVKSLYRPADELLILNYVNEYITANLSKNSDYGLWISYSHIYYEVYYMAKTYHLIDSATNTETNSNVIEASSSLVSDTYTDTYGKNGFKFKEFPNFSINLEKTNEMFDKLALYMSPFIYVERAICCLFKYYGRFTQDQIKIWQKLLEFMKYIKGTKFEGGLIYIPSISTFTTLFSHELKYNVQDMIDNLTDLIQDSLVEDNILSCLAVNDILTVTLEFIENLQADLYFSLELLSANLDSDSSKFNLKLDYLLESNKLDSLLTFLEYALDYMNVCEDNNKKNSNNVDSVESVNNYISNYINPTITNFRTPTWGKIITPTVENSFMFERNLSQRAEPHILKIINPRALTTVTKKFFSKCEEEIND